MRCELQVYGAGYGGRVARRQLSEVARRQPGHGGGALVRQVGAGRPEPAPRLAGWLAAGLDELQQQRRRRFR